MAYSDFTLDDVIDKLGVVSQEADLFTGLVAVPVPAWLKDLLAKGTRLALISEKSRSEFIVVPLLLAGRELSDGHLSIFSGQRLDIDPAAGLVGPCDFILALGPPVPPLRAPIATIVEAKKNDIEAALGQCIAQMVAARRFNESANRGNVPVYGCVTTGETWQFLRLENRAALINTRRFYMDDVGSILAAFQAIVKAAESASATPIV